MFTWFLFLYLFFHSFVFSPADKIQADEQMFTSYSEIVLGILGMFSENGLSFGFTAVKSQGILLVYLWWQLTLIFNVLTGIFRA